MSRLSQEQLKHDIITTDDILKITSMGKDIYEREIGTIHSHKNISSPLRVDKNPSVRIKPSRTTGIYIYTDYTTGEVFSPFTFIGKLYNLEFKDVMNKIAWDFGLKNIDGSVNNKKIDKVILPKKQIIEKPIFYEYQACSFSNEAHKYWGVLKEDFLNENLVYMACKIAINKKVIDIPKDEMCFVYETGDPKQTGIQILKIGESVTKANKWRTNIPNTYVRNLYKYNKENPVDNLFVVKSRKDELVLNLLGYDTVSTMSENAIILDQNMPEILQMANNVYINFGADDDGRDKSIIVQQKYKCKYFNTPKNLLTNEINDNFSYANTFGLKSLNTLIQNKLNKK